MNSDVPTPHTDSDDGWVGPKPSEAPSQPPRKKRKVLPYEDLYLSNLPNAQYYEKSFMHRDTVTHVIVTKTQFVITASVDGFVKFWKKQDFDLEFVKVFRCHLCPLKCLVCNCSGTRCASLGEDGTVKVFDVINFDMISMLKLDFLPSTCEFVQTSSDPQAFLAVSDIDSCKIFVYDAHGGSNEPVEVLESLHSHPVTIMKYNATYDTVISVDKAGILEYWHGPKGGYGIPKCVKFESKLDTDLFEFVKCNNPPISLCISPHGQEFATLTIDRKIRVFKFLTGKLSRVFDESVESVKLQQQKQQIPNMEFTRRLAVEREVEKSGVLGSLLYDESGHMLLYPTVLGIKVVNIYTNKLVRVIGKPENFRFLQLALFQGNIKKNQGTLSIEQEAADNPNLENSQSDPTLIATAFKKNRFFVFTSRDATNAREATDADRDVFNEKPSKEDIIAATDDNDSQRIFETATIHTSMGDINLKLFLKECPKTVENFCVHARNGYYNGHIFHRVIKQFMIQTGDPLGTGVGGESIWGGEFEDEFHPSLRHDRPYTVSMANAGPNTNGSQFFVTLVPTPWLDKKHTVFGRVVKGMETVVNIGNVKTNPKTDKPYEDVTVISITVK